MLFGKEKEEISILIDIGNGSITGSIVVFSKSELPTFVYVAKSVFPILPKSQVKELLKILLENLDSTFKKLVEEGLNSAFLKNKEKRIAHVVFSFSSPWFYSKTMCLNLSQEVPFVISENFLEDIINKESTSFENELRKNLDEDEDFEIIESSIINTKINGYPLKNSIGKKATQLDAYLFMSVLEKRTLDIISQVVLKHTHIPKEKIIMHTFPFIEFAAFRDIFINYSDFLIMDISSEVTDITLVRDEVIMQTVTIPSGRNFAMRHIAKSLNTTYELAESTLHLYILEKLDPEHIEKMQSIISDIEKEWSIYLEQALSELDPNYFLPGRIYLTADEDILDLYCKFLKLTKNDQTQNFRKNVDIVNINNKLLSPFYKNASSNVVDSFIAILAIFYSKMMRN